MTESDARAKSSTWRRRLARAQRWVTGPGQARNARRLVLNSGLFDPQWYLEKYPDVAAAGLNPLDHFLDHGGSEGRSPGPRFDTRWYMDAYPDVQGSGLNPLVHFVLHGKGRASSLEALPPPSSEEAQDIQELLDTPLFDARWYAKTHKVSAEPISAARHYLRVGGSKGLPASRAFDGAQYLNANSDVAAAGGAPLLHYLRHGKSEGRRAFRHGLRSSHASPLYFDDRALPTHEALYETAWTPASDFSESNQNTLQLGGAAVALFPQDARLEPEAMRACVLFARLMKLPVEGFVRVGRGEFPITDNFAEALNSTDLDAPVQDGWFSSDNRLSLRLAPQADDGAVVRALQITSTTAVLLAEVFVGAAGALLRIHMENPLLPLLLVVTNAEGAYRSSHLVPFPSLFRGGLHEGESEALGRGGSSGDRRRTHGLVVLRDLLGWRSAPPASLHRVEVDIGRATGNEPIFSTEVQQWLSHLGIEVAPILAAPIHDGQAHCVRAVAVSPPESRRSGGVLTITADSIPSLLAISSRRLSNGTGAFVLAEGPGSPIPRLFVRPPTSAPLNQTGFPAFRETAPSAGRRPGLLAAIRHSAKQPPELSTLAYPVATELKIARTARRGKARGSVTVILSGKRGEDFKRSFEALQRQTIAADMQVVMCCDNAEDLDWVPADANASTALKGDLSTAAALNAAAARHDQSWILFVNAGVVAHDARTVEALIDMASGGRIATASCMRLFDAGFANGQAVTVRSAGLFPSHIDFRGSPALAFDALDVSTALARSTYPVVANGFEFMLVPQEAWRDLGGFDADAQPFEGFALDFQLRALADGWTNICTTLVSVLDLNRTREERPDVTAPERLTPGVWGDILERVTTVRRLD